ncbi:hypothetical protein AMELA_G00107070 [Ameiurus melas]|uniref:Protein kinase domain-containing protein n=1 Tax=Ameiurus melas TaxID=219545 RepID=A0A7J6AU92_AMEME|nr:hypothetical protein AMELA_G00107070 [Ameiurus melas]
MLEGKPPLSDVHPLKAMLMVAQSKHPILNLGQRSENFQSFINSCLLYDHTQRPSAKHLLKHAFISNIHTQIRGIRHEIVAHMQKEKKKEAEKRREVQRMEKESVQAGSPPRHRGPGPQMSNPEMEQQQQQQQQMPHSPGFYQKDVIIDNLNFAHEHKIHPPSPSLQRRQVANPSKVKRSYSAQPQKQHQHGRSPSRPIPVPQICVSPQDEMTRNLRHKSPDSAKRNLRHYNSWNAGVAHEYRRRSNSHSPCRRGQQDTCGDENGNSMRRSMLRMSTSQECLTNVGQIDLSRSAPESSLQQMMGTRDVRRLYSESSGNFLGVPQSHLLPSVNYSEEKENNNRGRRYSSQNNMDIIFPESPQKTKLGIVNSMKALVRNMGLSPRGSPRHSPASSRSASPCSDSPTPSSPYGSPFSPPAEWPVRFN